MTASGAWLQRFHPRPAARLRLFCFHHAGVGAAVYRLWGRDLPADIEVCAVQLPGRANRLFEPPLERIEDIVDGALDAIRPQLDRPYALFGHSMGAVVAGECVRRLAALHAPAPRHLFASGRRPSHLPDPLPPLDGLDDAAFVAEIHRRFGGIPPEVMADADVMAMLLPSLRADIRALERFGVRQGAVIDCPVTALGGTDDPHTPRAHLEAWRAVTHGAFDVRQFPGDHFYLEPQRAALLASIVQALTEAS